MYIYSARYMEDHSGQLYVFEGPDGVGKTSVVRHTTARLRSSGTSCTAFSLPGNKKGTLGELVYRIHHDPRSMGLSLEHPLALQLLHVAAHVDAIDNRIKPALQTHQVVLLDRYWWSVWVYGKVAGVAENQLSTAIAVEKQVWAPTKPAIIFCIRSGPSAESADSPRQRLQAHYTKLAKREGRRTKIVTLTNEASLESTVDVVLREIRTIQTCGEGRDGATP